MSLFKLLSSHTRRATAGLVYLLLIAFSANGQAATDQAVWQGAACSSCHGSTYIYPPSADSLYGAILNSPPLWNGAGATYPGLKAYMNSPAFAGKSSAGTMIPAINAMTNGEVAQIEAYILAARNGTVSTPAFSNTSVGSFSSATLTITNVRSVFLDYNTVTITGTNSGDFSVTAQSCPSRNVPGSGGSCTITVRFTPQSFGTRTATLNLSFYSADVNDPVPSSRTISLSGLGLGPSFGIGSSTLNFSTMEGTGVTASTIISNSGNANLTLSNLALSGSAAADYSIVAGSGNCAIGGTVPPSCNLVVSFNPPLGTLGARNATLTITHTAPGATQAVSLNGTSTVAPAAVISVDQSSLSFGSVQLGSSLPQSAVTVTNTGDLALNWTSLAITGATPADFTRGGTCAVGVAVPPSGGTCTLIMSFAPAALGARSATLTLASNASNGTPVVTMTGTGTPVAAPLVTLNPAVLHFGTQTIGGLYQAKVITLSNTGNANLAISSLNLAGTGFSLVSASPCPAVLTPAATCNIQVLFNPAVVSASMTGTVTIVSNAAGSPHTVAIDGQSTTAAAPVLTWQSTGPLNFGTVATGSISAEQIVTLINSGPGGATLNLVNIIGTHASSFGLDLVGCQAGQVFYEGQTCQVKVRFAPASLGTKLASIQVASTGASPGVFDLQGTGSGGLAANIGLSAAAFNFGNVKVGASSAPNELRLRNSGSSVLHIASLSLSGPFSMQNRSCPAAPFDLQPGFECSVTLVFSPGGEGLTGGVLRVQSNAADAPNADVALSGNGEAEPKASGGGGGGGCSIAAGDAPFDPTLWLIVLAAIGVLGYRRWQARSVRDRKTM